MLLNLIVAPAFLEENPKLGFRNSKQARMIKIKMIKTARPTSDSVSVI
jgi:hypothetical protein